ncbi:MAG: glycosyltransferase, partial [Actinobacteria bacterium]|nr:glycosyltransferase [Actinomycetota bacterium]
MRVALLLPALAGGGAERVFLDIARGLVDRSIGVDVVLVHKRGSLLGFVPAGARLVSLDVGRTVMAGPALRRYLARERPAVVISGLNPTNVANVVVSRLVRPRIPAVVTQHNTVSMVSANSDPRRAKIALIVARWLFPRATRVVAVSKGVADDMAATLRLDRAMIEVIYNPVISPRIEQAGRAPVTHPWLVDRTGPVLLAVGRLTPQKDFPM